MNNRAYTKAELGMLYGMMIGASIFLIMFALTSELLWVLAVGIGLALGLGLRASMDERAR